ncbi:uncharacterized protein HMPREF1541_08164 [Cyphellophora europaea CBS 101466]|uniref:Zn(2)-C6 fungal-type domain-containing protein n=1 Tax=Cyphellophora europaea (strain CBS 101466) TaxID=1220924 RepID=W2RN51_CYPE1|nr:uncharacterized protein HMPREF1541_08164 [Cyphellophora europaea CBS 101466]ETN37174.1 hypothetical protein HMPREF1541_08164 [Cyphellophora europaea CBS 101466]
MLLDKYSKLRHVKCDEALPHCQRCIKAKRPCHYTDPSVKPDDPVKFVVYAAQKEPTPFPGLTRSERRSLHHFQHRSAEEIPSPFRSELWSRIILQVAERSPAVRHGIFALSSMHEYFSSPDTSQALLSDFSMHHYNKSIRNAIRITAPDESFDALLLTSVMFCALEGLKGDFEQSLQHALSGLRIIARGRQGCHPSSAAIPDDMLPSIFLALQTQVMELEDLSIFRVYPDVAQKFPPLPDHFSDVEEAMRYLQILLNQMIGFSDRFHTACQHMVYVPAEVPEPLLPEFTAIRDWFYLWDEAVSRIDTIITGSDGKQHKALLLLKIYQSVMRTVIDSLDKQIPSVDSFEPEIMGILKLAEVFLQSQSGWQSSSFGEAVTQPIRPSAPSPVFSISLGVVPVLFEIAHRARNPQLREEALRLLRSCNRREGVWDSQVAARIAERHNALQDEVDARFAEDSTDYRVFITDIGLLTEGNIPFVQCPQKYMIVPAGAHLMDNYWLGGFNPPSDQERFESIA